MSAQEALNTALRAIREQRERQPSQALLTSLNALPQLPPEEFEWAKEQLLKVLPLLENPVGAGLLAVWFGAWVEKDLASVEMAPETILKTMLGWTSHIDTSQDSEEPSEELLLGLEYLGQGLVAHLSRSERAYSAACRTEVLEEIERVENWSVGALWVKELIGKVSGELLVLHGEMPKGARLRYRNISNCFHLFTLLQAALVEIMPGSGTLDSQLMAAAQGKVSVGGLMDQAWWHYGLASPQPTLAASVWGEASPSSIPALAGVQVLVLWPPLLGKRSWDSGFFGPVVESALPSVEVVEELPPDDVERWRRRIGLLPQ